MSPASQIAFGALATFVAGAALIATVWTHLAKGKATAHYRFASPFDAGWKAAVTALIGGAIPAVFARAISDAVDLEAMSTGAFAGIGGLCALIAYLNFRRRYDGVDGCAKMLVCAWGIYGVVWAALGAVLLA